MIVVALSVIATGIFLIGLGVWILVNLPDFPTRMDETGKRWKAQECTFTKCVPA